jgi:DNA-binding CsgD family transcriptional regulator
MTAQGMSSRVPQEATNTVSPLTAMTARQRAIMSLAASGVSTTEIARRLVISQDAVRQDLSKCYRILIPAPSAADDLRTLAIFAYLSLVNEDDNVNGDDDDAEA